MCRQVLSLCKGVGYPIYEPLKGVEHDSFRLDVINRGYYMTARIPPAVAARMELGSFSKPRRLRQRELHQTKGLMSKTIAVHVRFESWYISLPSSTN